MTQRKIVFNLNERLTSSDLNELQDDLETYLQTVQAAFRQAGTEYFGDYDKQSIVIGGFDARAGEPATLTVGAGVLVQPANYGFPGGAYVSADLTTDFPFTPWAPGSGASRFDLIVAVDAPDESTSDTVDIYNTSTKQYTPELRQKSSQSNLLSVQLLEGINLAGAAPSFRAALYLVVVPDGAADWTDCSLFRVSTDLDKLAPGLANRAKDEPEEMYSVTPRTSCDSGIITGTIDGYSARTGVILGGSIQRLTAPDRFDTISLADMSGIEVSSGWEIVELRELKMWDVYYPAIAWDHSPSSDGFGIIDAAARARFSGILIGSNGPLGNDIPSPWLGTSLQTPLAPDGAIVFAYDTTESAQGWNQGSQAYGGQVFAGSTASSDYGYLVQTGSLTGVANQDLNMDLSAVPVTGREGIREWTLVIDPISATFAECELWEETTPGQSFWADNIVFPSTFTIVSTVPGPGSRIVAVVRFSTPADFQGIVRFLTDTTPTGTYSLYLRGVSMLTVAPT